jgi:hypothetical protein
MLKNKTKAIQLIESSFLSDVMKLSYKTLLNNRYERIG